MIDLCIAGGTLIDGTGSPGRQGDLGIDDGRIVAMGEVDGPARRTIDATDQIVAPGFVDIHTHYDAQVFWDPALTPSCFHGVTSVFAGNCGFSIAPYREEDGDYLLQLLARVEGMPVKTLEAGVPWGSWNSTAEYFGEVESRMALNMGFMVGHSAMRRAVMGEEASAREATADEIAAMETFLSDGLAAGGMGFSTSGAPTHNDHHGLPVPSRAASREEFLALCRVVRRYPGTTVEMVPGAGLFDENIDLLIAMSEAANRPLNWNVVQVNAEDIDIIEGRLAKSRQAIEHGGRLVPLTLPDALRTRLNFASGFLLDTLPGWREPMALPHEEKKALFADPVRRRALADQAAKAPRRFLARGFNNWPGMTIGETDQDAYRGRQVAEIAETEGRDAFDVLCDIVVADDLRTGVYAPDRGDDDESWKLRADLWRSGEVIVGASDAGAHLDMISTWSYPTRLLGEATRERQLLSWEEAVRLLTTAPAALYGLRDRGRLAEGWRADVTVFDPATVAPKPTEWREDLPAGAGRLYAEAHGVPTVVVNGVPLVVDGQLTGDHAGQLVRSGTDTDTVTARGSSSNYFDLPA